MLLGKAETEGNGCGQTIVLEREGGKHEEDRRAEEGGEKNGKILLNLSDSPLCM